MYRRAIRRKCRSTAATAPPQRAPVRGTASPLWSLANIPARPGLGALVQPKLIVGAANDPAEHAADRAADQVMRMGEPAAPVAAGPAADGQVQRKCAACEDEAGPVRREASSAAGGGAASPAARSAIGSMGSGAPLPASERAFFEPRFGRDLSGVRVHDGPAADAASQSIAARAFTLGSDIAFARGEYRPGTGEGRQLMAHELAHVMQQDGDVLHRAPQEQDPGHGGTLPYREATELVDCMRIMGKGSEDYCNNVVLGTPMPALKYGAMTVSMTAGGPGATGTIQFDPDQDKCPKCNKIRLVQAVRIFEKPGQDYVWPNAEKNRNEVKTAEDKKKGIKANFLIDHAGAQCVKGTACSIYYRDHWPNATSSQDGSFDGTISMPASLWDGPRGDANDVFEFETCARCDDNGAILGCVDWGFTVDAAGVATMSDTSEHVQASATFTAALAKFNKYYANP